MQKILITLQKTKNLSLLTMRTQILNRWVFVAILVTGIILLSSCKPETIVVVTPESSPTQKASPTKMSTPLPTLTPTATQQPDWFLADEDLKDTKISLVHPWSGEIAAQMETLVSQFNAENQWEIQVTAQGMGSAQQVFQQSEAGIVIGNGPQVVIAPIEELAYWFKQGYLLSLDKYIQDSTLGLDASTLEDFFPPFWQQDIVNGEQLGIPISRDVHFLLYNQTWAKDLGFASPPVNYLQFNTQTCAAGAALAHDNRIDNNGMGGWIINRNDLVLLSWLRGFGIADFPEKEMIYQYNQPQTIKAFAYIRKLFDDGCAWVSRNPTPYEYFANRQALVISADLNDLSYLEHAMQIAGNEDQWIVLPYLSESGDPIVLSQGSSFGILRSNKAQELASWIFIRWLNEPEQQLQLAKANADLPVTNTLLSEFSATRDEKWQAVVALLEYIQPGPRTSDWRVARFVLPDAFYQTLQIHILPEQFPDIVRLLDETILSLSDLPASAGW